MTPLCLYEYKDSFSCCHIYVLVLIYNKLKVWHFLIWHNTENIKCLKTCSLSIIGDRETCGNNNQNTLSIVFWGNFLFNWSPKHHDSPKLGWDVAEINAIKLTDQWSHTSIPHICHRRHGRRPCKFFLAGANFYRFNAKNWQFTEYFAVITQKIGNLLCILS